MSISSKTRLVPGTVAASFVGARRLPIAFGSRTFLLLMVGLVFIGPAFANPHYLWAMLVWDAGVFMAWLTDLLILPRPGQLRVERAWSGTLMMDSETELRLTLSGHSKTSLTCKMIVDLPESLALRPPELRFNFSPKAENIQAIRVHPRHRGDAQLGGIYLRYLSPLGLAERLARVDLPQSARVYPSIGDRQQQSLNLLRSRRIEIVKRLSRKKGIGREFESLRDYRDGDAMRDVCWSASARRGKLIVKEFQIERSQPIWIVLDCGRLMRTRVGDRSKLDYAVSAALHVAEVAMFGGDRVGLLAYGRQNFRMVGLGRGDQQLRLIMDQLSAIEGEPGEADHFSAAARLMRKQSRRSLVVWITDLPDSAMTPEVFEGASVLLGRHLVIFAAVADPELNREANNRIQAPDDIFEAAAAMDVLHRREKLIAALRGRGAHTLEVSTQNLSPAIVREYLSMRERDLL